MSNIKLIKGECIEELKKIKPGEVDLFLLDLPYGQTNNEWDTEINLKDMWTEIIRISNHKNIYVIFFCTTKFGYKLINYKPKLFKYDLVWEKSTAQGFLSAKKMPLRAHEMIYIFQTQKRNENYDDYIELREYAKRLREEVIKEPIKTINLKINNGSKYPINHFLGSYKKTAKQFNIPNEKVYEKLTELYNLKELDYYLTYSEMKKIKLKYNNTLVYNPQMTIGKPYKQGVKEIKIKTNYGLKKKSEINNTGYRYPRSVLKYSNSKEKERIHTTQKPVELLEYLIITYSNKGDTICDFTMGSGSTGVACVNTDRNFIGIELNKDYFNKASERINKYIKK